MAEQLAEIQTLIDNQLPREAGMARLLSGSIGESPSKYSRSPAMWNAAFKAVGLDACHVAFDVRSENLEAFVAALRNYDGFIGANVTVPYKLQIMPLLDEISPMAAGIGAVNTFERTEEDRLVGHNSDADGLIASMTRQMPDHKNPFIETLAGMNALLIGAGGAGRAAAFALSEQLQNGRLVITNRSFERANELALAVGTTGANAMAFDHARSIDEINSFDLVVNASTVGQSGMRLTPSGKATCLEPYSSLAPLMQIEIDVPNGSDTFWRTWLDAAADSILENNAASLNAMRSLDGKTRFVDAVYSPDETTLLRHARYSGHSGLNGKGMLVMQAVSSFINRMTRRHLIAAGLKPETLEQTVIQTMVQAF